MINTTSSFFKLSDRVKLIAIVLVLLTTPLIYFAGELYMSVPIDIARANIWTLYLSKVGYVITFAIVGFVLCLTRLSLRRRTKKITSPESRKYILFFALGNLAIIELVILSFLSFLWPLFTYDAIIFSPIYLGVVLLVIIDYNRSLDDSTKLFKKRLF
jgi:heme/copper-type cytochrome/quinol oxidase subunit 2